MQRRHSKEENMYVIIKGMSKPKDCTECPCCNGETNDCRITGSHKALFEGGILDDCPIVDPEIIDSEDVTKTKFLSLNI
jgi:hypothetical protein